MIVTVNSQLLAQELRAVNKVSPSKPAQPILSHVWVHADQDGLHFYATDLEVGFITSCQADVQVGGTITLPAKRLLDIIEQLPNDDVQLTLDKGHVRMACGSFKSRLQTMPALDFPALPMVDGVPTKFEQGVLQSTIAKVSYALSDKNAKYVINGALLSQTGTRLVLVATDGKRLSMTITTSGEDATVETIIPTKALEILPTVFPDEPIDVSRSDKHLFFSCEERVFFSRMLEGKFPEYKRILPKNCDKLATVDRSGLAAALRRVGSVAEDNCATYFTFDQEGLNIKASSAEVGDATEHVAMTYQGDPLRVCANWRYVLDFLEAATSPTVTIEGSTPTGPLLLKDGDDFWNVVMTMRA